MEYLLLLIAVYSTIQPSIYEELEEYGIILIFFFIPQNLPKMNQKKNCPEVEVDLISEWFVIDDMFQFENIGVSHSVQNSRYLTCADCEMGPVGWNDLTSQKCYIALSRVKQS